MEKGRITTTRGEHGEIYATLQNRSFYEFPDVLLWMSERGLTFDVGDDELVEEAIKKNKDGTISIRLRARSGATSSR